MGLTVSEAPLRIYQRVHDLGIDVGILVNNAGFANNGRFDNDDHQREIDLVQVNVTSLMYLCRLFVDDFDNRSQTRIQWSYGRQSNYSPMLY